ncbi:hypothetical protein TRFO_40558 [Tritrichomonas foetus]|uniref:Uncharacterized protein n=1 Tax=Tritrichomonas foetus TaxID=1144522 RepID=A0A1J4J0M7_9EUKA|nr:hypothetical protein TRFO_40558 [Tritrichomonas foetus]|eukprot:OHS93128.1 hypothetical protein TRFO_40558 [Tritrichomonas foetus]
MPKPLADVPGSSDPSSQSAYSSLTFDKLIIFDPSKHLNVFAFSSIAFLYCSQCSGKAPFGILICRIDNSKTSII